MKKLLLILMISAILQMHKSIIMATVTIIHIFFIPTAFQTWKRGRTGGESSRSGNVEFKKNRLYSLIRSGL